MRVELLLLLLLSGCYLHHTLDPDAEAPRDAGTDVRDVGPDVPVDVGTCFAGDFVSVETEGCDFDEESSGTKMGQFFGPSAAVSGERLRLDLRNPDGSACTVLVDGLSEPIRDGFIARFERIADAWMRVSTNHIAVHDTSLCDGPTADECPLAMVASGSYTRFTAPSGRFEVDWGDEICRVPPCGEVRLLELARRDGDIEEIFTIAQGEISGDVDGDWRFANIRSWLTCTDESLLDINWAFWTQ